MEKEMHPVIKYAITFAILIVLFITLYLTSTAGNHNNRISCINCRSKTNIHYVSANKILQDVNESADLLTTPVCKKCIDGKKQLQYSTMMINITHLKKTNIIKALAINTMLSKLRSPNRDLFVTISKTRPKIIVKHINNNR